MTRWLVVAVLLAPLTVAPGLPIAPHASALLFAGAWVAWRCANPWRRAFAVLALVSFLVSGMHAWAVVGLAGLLGFLLVHQEATRCSDAEWAWLRRAIVAAVAVQVAWMGLQALGHDPLFVPLSYHGAELAAPEPSRLVTLGWFGNPMDTALYLGVSLPAIVALRPWLLLPMAVVIAAQGATVGLVSLAVTTLWLAWTRASRVVALALLVSLVIGSAWFLTRVDPQGLGLRPAGWAIAARLAWERPLVGWGPNAVDHRIQIVDATTNNRWNFFFNEWLQGAVELGVIGPALAAGYLVSLARRLRGRWLACGEALPAALALLAVSLFSIPLRIGPTALLAALYLGRLESIAQEAA